MYCEHSANFLYCYNAQWQFQRTGRVVSCPYQIFNARRQQSVDNFTNEFRLLCTVKNKKNENENEKKLFYHKPFL